MEYCAALAPWAVFNVNRAKDAPFQAPTEFMLQSKARTAISGAQRRHEHRTHGRPARILAPVPERGARWAKPGERPPSLLAPGEADQVIDRFDAYAAQWRAGGVKRNAR